MVVQVVGNGLKRSKDESFIRDLVFLVLFPLLCSSSACSSIWFSCLSRWGAEMANGGAGPQRGTTAAAAANLRRRRTAGGGAAGGTMLQFYTDDAPGLKISPNVVLVMSIGFIAFVSVLHVMGKLYFVRKD